MPELDLASPTTRYLQKLIRDQVPVHLKTQTGDLFCGQLRWQDGECLCVQTVEGEVLFWRGGVSFVRGSVS